MSPSPPPVLATPRPTRPTAATGAGAEDDPSYTSWAPSHSLSLALSLDPPRNAVQPFRGMSFDAPPAATTGTPASAEPPRSFVDVDVDAEIVEEPTEWFGELDREEVPMSDVRGSDDRLGATPTSDAPAPTAPASEHVDQVASPAPASAAQPSPQALAAAATLAPPPPPRQLGRPRAISDPPPVFTTGLTASPPPSPGMAPPPLPQVHVQAPGDQEAKPHRKGRGTLELERALGELVEDDERRAHPSAMAQRASHGSSFAPIQLAPLPNFGYGAVPRGYGQNLFPQPPPLLPQHQTAGQGQGGSYGTPPGFALFGPSPPAYPERKVPTRQRSKSETDIMSAYIVLASHQQQQLQHQQQQQLQQQQQHASSQDDLALISLAEPSTGDDSSNNPLVASSGQAYALPSALTSQELPQPSRKVANAPPIGRRNRPASAAAVPGPAGGPGGEGREDAPGSYTAGVVRRARSSIRQEPYRAYGTSAHATYAAAPAASSSAAGTASPSSANGAQTQQQQGFAPPPAGPTMWLQPGVPRTPYVYHSPETSPHPDRGGGKEEEGEEMEDVVTLESKTTPATIEAATRRRNPGTAARFVCDLCGETFTRRYNLRGHQRAHRNEKPYGCSYEGCDKAFARMHDCKRHELLHQGLRKYRCDPCARDFVRLDALQRHHRSEVGQVCVNQLKESGYVFTYDCTQATGPAGQGTGSGGDDDELDLDV